MMQYKKGVITNAWVWVVLIFIFLIFVTAIKLIGLEFASEGKLDSKSEDYVSTISGINLTEYTASRDEAEDPVFFTINQSGSNQKDFGLDISFAKEKATSIRSLLSTVFSLPEHFLRLFKLDVDSWSWLIDIINWFFNFAILFAITYFVLRR